MVAVVVTDKQIQWKTDMCLESITYLKLKNLLRYYGKKETEVGNLKSTQLIQMPFLPTLRFHCNM